MHDSVFDIATTVRPTVRTTTVDGPPARTHLWRPIVVFALALLVVHALRIDWRIAHTLYAWEGYRWILKHAFFTETLMHNVGHDLVVLAWTGVALTWLVSLRRASLARWRLPLGYLASAVLLSTVCVALLKRATRMDCPWDIEGLGGTRPLLGLLDARPAYLPDAGCFPAGHAGSGYAWLALYFFFLMSQPSLRRHGLAIGATTGLVFGLGQQLRGAHFVSHDLWAALLCWTIAFVLHRVFMRHLA
jgi:membrane-associated PAP2 superfamily phosphatase